MRDLLLMAGLAGILCGPGLAVAADRTEYEAGKARIAAEYQVDRQKCGSRHGNAADLCIARAQGALAVAKAELKALHQPSPRANYEAALARAQATYANASEECDDQDGQARKRCVREAATARDLAKAEARLR